MKYLTRNNMGEVAQMTGLPLEEVEAFLSYHEEAGNHHAPIPQPRKRRARVLTPRVHSDGQEPLLGTRKS